jgi:hypothetical protein
MTDTLSDIDPESLVDGLELTDDGKFVLHYGNEASVRRALARLARACGWAVVREEVVVPGWGRIDLVLAQTVNAAPYIVELKLELTKPAAIRKAFQQVDGYSRWWTANKGQRSTPLLAACVVDVEAIQPAADAYLHVHLASVSRLMDLLHTDSMAMPMQVELANDRLAELERQVAVHRAARDALLSPLPSSNFADLVGTWFGAWPGGS